MNVEFMTKETKCWVLHMY